MRRRTRRRVSGQFSLAFALLPNGLRRFWQRRYYDFNVYSTEKMREKLDYIHTNPVKRQLVMHPKDWPWSSWAFYAKGERGVVKIEPTGQQPEKSPTLCQTRKGRAPSSHGRSGMHEWCCSLSRLCV